MPDKKSSSSGSRLGPGGVMLLWIALFCVLVYVAPIVLFAWAHLLGIL